jgi:hypothetical protein
MTPTPEQLSCIEAATSTKDNLIIHALAGAAKTSTLVMIANAVKDIPTLALAFNKRIQVEMQSRLPGNCEAFTLNSIGHRTWASAIGKRLTIVNGKTYGIVSEILKNLSGKEAEEAYETMSDIIRAIDYGKTAGYIPTGKFDTGKRLMNDDELFASLDEEPSILQQDIIRQASIEGLKQALQGTMDFNDQILMPTCFHGAFPAYPLTLIDEAQDLSALNHVMLGKIVRKNRLIAVGDENQSIYGFRGAHEDSMALLAQTFHMKSLQLSVSFRCARKIVEEARWRAPIMQYPEWAVEGEVQRLDKYNVETFRDGDVILCRNNAPLFNTAIRLLKNGKYPELVGNDIGKALVKVMKKLGPTTAKRETALGFLAAWRDAKNTKARDKSKINDQAECIGIFLEQGETLGDAIAYAEHLLAISGSIKLMTIHKAKGLEWDRVFILDSYRIRTDKDTQEKNILYVAQTRAKNELIYIDFENFEGV